MKTLLTTSFRKLRDAGACTPRYQHLRKALTGVKDGDAINLLTILDANGIEDALWALQATHQDCERIARLMTADFAEVAVTRYWTNTKDARPMQAVIASRRFANGEITQNELSAAWSAARSAAESAESAAWSAARSALSAAESAAESAAWSAARSAESAAWSAARSAESAAWSAARSAARSAAWSAALSSYADIFRSYLAAE